ncbi:MAG: helicase RepA family protein [Verrucomicrobiales bacterium]|jgi:RecA-family ATPase|nr:helicase RepA family protein [Verrucomicrobiales bacterium]
MEYAKQKLGESSGNTATAAHVTTNASKLERFKVDVRTAFLNGVKRKPQIIPGLTAGTVGLLVAEGGLGKSFLSIEIALGVAAKAPIAGGLWPEPELAGSTVVLAAEDDGEEIGRRLHAIGKQFPELQRGLDNVQIYSLAGTILNVTDPKWFKELRQLAENNQFLIGDPLCCCHDRDENNAAEMAGVINAFKKIIAGTGCAVLLTHHTSKSRSKDSPQDMSRGSTALVNGVRVVYVMTADTSEDAGENSIRVECAKSNNLSPDERATKFLSRLINKEHPELGGVLVAS